ncbi:hypothetical protein PM082_024974 [Marasmius tenuissimus]|nr:hypothetical protein PM082_024974 [Marasmius tenuissimus]
MPMNSPVVFIFVFILTVISTALGTISEDGGVTRCEDMVLDWYQKAVGETPCKTYERVRQLCNPDFRVPNITYNPDDDGCDDQVGDCCCNNIAFSLRMLCFTCQQGEGTHGYGVDADKGTYQRYLSPNGKECQPRTTKFLLPKVQTGVCNAGIRLFDGLYEKTYWEEGSWFYIWSRNALTNAYNKRGDAAFRQCDGLSHLVTTSVDSTPFSTSTSSSYPDTQMKASQSVSKGTIAGICAGIIGVGLLLWFLHRLVSRRIRQNNNYKSTQDSGSSRIEQFVFSDMRPKRNKHEPPESGNIPRAPETPPPPYRKI